MRGYGIVGMILSAALVTACTADTRSQSEDTGHSLEPTCGPLDSMPHGAIAFSRLDASGSAAIYLMDPDGSDRRCLVDTPGQDEDPAWSPDGTSIAFTSDADGDSNIYTMRADGTRLVQITDSPLDEYGPVWSPDGRRIAYSSWETEEGPFAIHVMQRDGTNAKAVLESGGDFEYIQLHDWSPDGGTLLWDGYPGATDLLTMDPEGSHIQPLAGGPGEFGSGAVYSPDGSQVLFQADLRGGCLYVMNADGTGLRRLTRGCAEGVTLTWSPDGRWIAWAGGSHGPADAYVMRADGSDRRLIDDGSDAAYLAWQPDSST